MRPDDVLEIQCALNDNGAKVPESGLYDERTRAALLAAIRAGGAAAQSKARILAIVERNVARAMDRLHDSTQTTHHP